MWIAFFVLALIAVIILVVHINLELGSLDKRLSAFTDALRKRYEPRAGAQSDKQPGA
jgi:hypothetical protein